MSQAAPKRSIIGEIDLALAAGSGDKRIKVLMGVTDLFVTSSEHFTEAETKLFDDVMGHLIKHVERRALVELGRRLAPVSNAPLGIIKSLARSDAIDVSGPVLKQSKRLSDDDLIEIAKTKSQAHLVNIARRSHINEPVADVLVDHGDAEVANEVAINDGARLSQLTMAKLVMRADGDDRLTGAMSRRSDITPALFKRLLQQATETVRENMLVSARPEQAATIRQVLDEISAQIGKPPPARNFAEAQRTVAAFSQDPDLTRRKILEFADANRIAEMIAALSILSGVPLDQIETLVNAPTAFGLMVLCRSVALDWNTAGAVLSVRGPKRAAPGRAYDELLGQFDDLSATAAQQLVHFWMGRQKIARNFSQAV